jgi:hypothetical protein
LRQRSLIKIVGKNDRETSFLDMEQDPRRGTCSESQKNVIIEVEGVYCFYDLRNYLIDRSIFLKLKDLERDENVIMHVRFEEPNPEQMKGCTMAIPQLFYSSGEEYSIDEWHYFRVLEILTY